MNQYMKHICLYSFALLSALVGFSSCATEEALDPNSVISIDKYEKNEFDLWLDANYIEPYNIEFKYRYENIESDLNYYTVPADYDCAVKLAHIVKHLCIEAYDEAAGIDFTRRFFPKEFFLIGEWEYKNNGTYILGTAESGKKILLSGVNYLEKYISSAAQLNSKYIKTVHHEFTHILAQTKDFPAGFREITGSSYVADSWSSAPYNTDFLGRGFISAYAQNSAGEDFAEMLSIFLVNDELTWNGFLATAASLAAGADELIEAKLDYVKSYMLDNFGIDIELMRTIIGRRQSEVLGGAVDLTDLEVK